MTKPLYYAEGRNIHMRPIEKKAANGETLVALGFRCAVATEEVGEEGAQAIADLMNRGEMLPDLVEALREIVRDIHPNTGGTLGAIRKTAFDAIAKTAAAEA